MFQMIISMNIQHETVLRLRESLHDLFNIYITWDEIKTTKEVNGYCLHSPVFRGKNYDSQK